MCTYVYLTYTQIQVKIYGPDKEGFFSALGHGGSQ